MIIPYSTDAPIYHFPRATLGMIAANVAVHVAWCLSAPDAAEPYMLELGGSLHPVQWLSHNFLHADFLHLFFNMVFLWAYGIIVEGKIGGFRFLLVYLGIGTLHGAAIQAAYLGAAEPSHVLGASAIVFGLMAICMIWAPVNELACFYLFLFGIRPVTGTFEIRVYVFALLQLAIEALSAVLQYVLHGDPMSSGLLHISGAFWGLLVGIVMVKTGWVDCEGWDVFSRLAYRSGLRKAWKEREARLDHQKESERLPKERRSDADHPALTLAERAEKRLAKLRRAIELGDMMGAEAAFGKWMAATARRPPREPLMEVIKAMHAREELAASVPPMRILCKVYPENAEKVRLKLAQILLRQLERPTEALRQLEQIPDGILEGDLERLRQKLLDKANTMIAEGVLEVDEEA